MSVKSSKASGLATNYLIFYNFAQTVGWSYLLYQIVNYYITGNVQKALYETVKWTLIIFQNAAVLEVIHAVIRIVPSNPMITAQQVASRVFLVCGVLIPTIAGSQTIGLPLALVAWSITEVIRYANYTLNLMNAVPYFLVWWRYTTFIVLYPVGVTGELLCLYAAQNEVKSTGMWSIDLPNTYNFSFNYAYFLTFVMLLYIPLFPQMYLHMFTQRRKVLGNEKQKEKPE